MLSFKLISNSLRGASTLVTTQIGYTAASSSSTSGPRLSLCGNPQTSPGCQKHQIRPFSLSHSMHLNPTPNSRTKVQKINAAFMEAEMNLPMKPKKPVNPWLAFVRERKDEWKQDNKMNVCEMSSTLAKEWRVLDKAKYEKEYDNRRQLYLEEVENYEKSLTDQQRDYLTKKKDLKRASKALRALRKTNPPKMPRTSFNLYTYERCQDPYTRERLRDSRKNETLREFSREYRALSESELEKYKNLQQEDRVRFQNEFLKWYESIKEDKSLTKAGRDQAENMYARFKALNYVK